MCIDQHGSTRFMECSLPPMYIADFDAFYQQAEELFRARPLDTRYCIKYRNCDGKLVLKVTDNRTCLQYKTDQQADLKKLERLNNLFLALTSKGDATADHHNLLVASCCADLYGHLYAATSISMRLFHWQLVSTVSHKSSASINRVQLVVRSVKMMWQGRTTRRLHLSSTMSAMQQLQKRRKVDEKGDPGWGP
ncbi:hypothetical protein QJQ45_024372 [Haematococcus lacustris]|nr:hypothetical protein QJQ45_024372 [Haematococcus lacustris]